jgi:hypothetical protein
MGQAVLATAALDYMTSKIKGSSKGFYDCLDSKQRTFDSPILRFMNNIGIDTLDPGYLASRNTIGVLSLLVPSNLVQGGIKGSLKVAKRIVAEETEVAVKLAKKARPIQDHHFATNKHSLYTERMEEVVQKFDLDLNGAWNKARLPHLGRHPNDYHDWVIERMRKASSEAGGDRGKFLELFEELVKKPVIENPELLRKSGWRSL